MRFLRLSNPAAGLVVALVACGGGGSSNPPAFAITSLAPARGTTLGGAAVVVSGRGFGAAATVTFDGVAASGTVVVSANEIHCATPPHASGTVTVAVANSSSESTSAPGAFTFDAPPTAVAAWDRIVTTGASVPLDGSASTDPDSPGALAYSWSLSVPAGSGAALSGPATATPSFVADVAGTYVATLVVSDGTTASAPSAVTVRTSDTASRVPDSGLATCVGASATVPCPVEGTPYFGQDASYVLVPPRLTISTDAVRDEITGLTWERADEGLYNWYEAAGRSDPVYNATGVDVCGALDRGGYSDWRLPSAHELYTIGELPADGSNLDHVAFPGLGGGPYWTSTVPSAGPGAPAAQLVFPAGGYGRYGGLTEVFWVVCVRGPAWGVNAFVDQGDGTVRDDATGLVWEKSPSGVARRWRDALAWCEGLVLGGRDDWRMPSIKELQTIAMPTDAATFPPAAAPYWSSTGRDGVAWTLSGDFIDYAAPATSLLVRCVR